MKKMRYAERLFAPCTSNYSYFTTNIAYWFRIFFKTKIYGCIKFFWPIFQITTFIPCIFEQIYKPWMKIDYVLMITILKWRFLNEALFRDLKARRHPKYV